MSYIERRHTDLQAVDTIKVGKERRLRIHESIYDYNVQDVF